MDKDGQLVIAYLGEDRHIYLHKPGKSICEFPARIIHSGPKMTIYITDIPEKFDKGEVIAPMGYEIKGL